MSHSKAAMTNHFSKCFAAKRTLDNFGHDAAKNSFSQKKKKKKKKKNTEDPFSHLTAQISRAAETLPKMTMHSQSSTYPLLTMVCMCCDRPELAKAAAP